MCPSTTRKRVEREKGENMEYRLDKRSGNELLVLA